MSLSTDEINENKLKSIDDIINSIYGLAETHSKPSNDNNFNYYEWKWETEATFQDIVKSLKHIENNIDRMSFSTLIYSSANKILEKDIDFLKMRFNAYYELKEINIKTIQQLISNTVVDLYNRGITVFDIQDIIKALNKFNLKLLDYESIEYDIKEHLDGRKSDDNDYLCISNNKFFIINTENLLLDSSIIPCEDYINTFGDMAINTLGLSDEIVNILNKKNIYNISDFFNIKWLDILIPKYYTDGTMYENTLIPKLLSLEINSNQIIELKNRLERLEFEVALNLDFDKKIRYIVISIIKNRFNLVYIKEFLKNININTIYSGVPLYAYIVEKLIGINKKQITNIIKYFIDIGADLDLFGNDLLIMMSSTNKDNLNVDACKVLLENGVDPNVVMDYDGPFSSDYCTIYDRLYEAHYRWEREEELWDGAAMGFDVHGSYVDDWLSPKEDIEELQKLFSQYGYLPSYEIVDPMRDDY